jgi:hypothetical protein
MSNRSLVHALSTAVLDRTFLAVALQIGIGSNKQRIRARMALRTCPGIATSANWQHGCPAGAIAIQSGRLPALIEDCLPPGWSRQSGGSPRDRHGIWSLGKGRVTFHRPKRRHVPA